MRHFRLQPKKQREAEPAAEGKGKELGDSPNLDSIGMQEAI